MMQYCIVYEVWQFMLRPIISNVKLFMTGVVLIIIYVVCIIVSHKTNLIIR